MPGEWSVLSTPQVIDVMSSYTARSNSNLPINFSFLIEATYTWSLGPVNLIPEAMLVTVWQFQPGFTESGADSLNLAL